MTMEPSRRTLSPFNLFQRFKRFKVVEAREKNGDQSNEAIHRIIMAVAGLEDYSSIAVDALSTEDVKDLRRIKIRSALLRNGAPPKDDSDFLGMNKMMSASWKAIDDFGSFVFEELAEEARSTWGATAPPSVHSKAITPQLLGDESARVVKADPEGSDVGSNGDPESGSDEPDGLSLVQEVTFPRQLMNVIEHQSTKGGAITASGEKVLDWLPSGEAFVIRDKAAFEREVLPKHFSAKCKFMSFVRKLYRWGFRQLEKDSRGILIFSHPNFVRGDKKRCLKMRSVVKKPPAQRKLSLGPGVDMGGLSPLTDSVLSGFRSSSSPTSQYHGMGGNGMRGYAPSVAMDPWNPSPQMYPFRGESIVDGLGYGGPSMPRPYPRASTGRMTSTEMFEAALRMERLEQREEERKMHMMDMLRARNDYNMPSFNPRPHMGLSEGYGVNPSLGKMSNTELAYEMMKQDSRMEAAHALELAKRLH